MSKPAPTTPSALARAARRQSGRSDLVLLAVVAAVLVGGMYAGYRFTRDRGPDACWYYLAADDALCVTPDRPDAQDCIPTELAASFRKAAVACFPRDATAQADELVKASGKRRCGGFRVQESCR